MLPRQGTHRDATIPIQTGGRYSIFPGPTGALVPQTSPSRLMSAFFDSALVEEAGVGFIREGKIEESLRRLVPGAFISKGRYSYSSRSELRDLAWNHMDQNHRPLIHRTYGEAARFFVDARASFSLTRFGNWPIVIPVFDGYYRENCFYQVMVLFGLIAVVNIIECNAADKGTQIDVSWAIASPRWLRLLHPFLNRRFVRLNETQNREDDPIRDRRVALRARGYRFKTDEPDFLNSNVVENNTIFPPVSAPGSVTLDELPNQSAVRISFAERAFIFRRDHDAVDVWPGVCLHEGAEIDIAHLGATAVKCPWHGLEFAAQRLVQGGRVIELCGVRLELADEKITMNPLRSDIGA